VSRAPAQLASVDDQLDSLLDRLALDGAGLPALASYLSPYLPPSRPAPPPRKFTTVTPGGYITLQEAGALAGASPETVRFWIWKGKLTSYKPGRAVLVKRCDLLTYIDSRESVAVRASKMRARASRHVALAGG
jgi:excisionase family DNA binding protein